MLGDSRRLGRVLYCNSTCRCTVQYGPDIASLVTPLCLPRMQFLPLVSDSRSRGLLGRLDSHVTPNKSTVSVITCKLVHSCSCW
jgi:hypothetical protein